MKAKEAWLWYRIEWEWTLYLVPTPLVLIDSRNRFHSETQPAIRWKNGKEFFYLQWEKLEKKLWKKIVEDKLSPQEVFAISNTEVRRIAYEYMDKTKMKQLDWYKILDEKKDKYWYDMKIIQFNIDWIWEMKYYNCFCPSTNREYFLWTKANSCEEAKAQSFGKKEILFDYEY
jgi:hypothetical protein